MGTKMLQYLLQRGTVCLRAPQHNPSQCVMISPRISQLGFQQRWAPDACNQARVLVLPEQHGKPSLESRIKERRGTQEAQAFPLTSATASTRREPHSAPT